MQQSSRYPAIRRIGLSLLTGAALLVWFSCSGDRIFRPDDGQPISTLPRTSVVAAGTYAGILFGSMMLPNSQLGSVHTGAWRHVTPSSILAELSGARARNGRLILQLVPGDQQLKNPDGSFSLEKWKAAVDRYRTVDFSTFINDGTLVGHYLIDEPQSTTRWKGGVSQVTVEAMARYSRERWPDLATLARVAPTWLAQAPVTYRYLDAAYAQYHSRKGDIAKWLPPEVAAAKRLGLGLVVALNALDGGTSASGIPGLSPGKFAMNAAELTRYGTVLLNESYGCAFIMYKYYPTYYNRADIKSAMADLSQLARRHAATSCRQ